MLAASPTVAAPTARIEARWLERMATTIHGSIRPEFPWYARGVRILALAAVAALGCSGTPAPAASGKLVFEPQPENLADVLLATEAEVLRSAPLRDRVNPELRDRVAADAITVSRTPGTMILEVGVRDEDPRRAAEQCNGILRAYIDYRMEKAVLELGAQQQALAVQLEKHPGDARLQERLRDLELARATLGSDVRVLEPCAAASRR